MTTKKNPDGTPANFGIPKRDAAQAKLEQVEVLIEVLDQRLTERMESLTNIVDNLAVQVAQTNQGIRDLRDVVRQTAENINRLGDRIERLGDRIERIAAIAESQNMLAVEQQRSVNLLIQRLAA